jgi:hypothetical protein
MNLKKKKRGIVCLASKAASNTVTSLAGPGVFYDIASETIWSREDTLPKATNQNRDCPVLGFLAWGTFSAKTGASTKQTNWSVWLT